MQKISLKEKAIGAAKFVGAQFLPVTDLSRRRLAICESCPLFQNISRRCGACGCFVDEKVKYENEKCPKGKW